MISLNRLAIRAALAANPELGQSVAYWVEHVSGESLAAAERDAFQNALINSLTAKEALAFRSLPRRPAIPALLSQEQMNTVLKIVDRMPEPQRASAQAKIKKARSQGRLEVRNG